MLHARSEVKVTGTAINQLRQDLVSRVRVFPIIHGFEPGRAKPATRGARQCESKRVKSLAARSYNMMD